MPKNELEDLVKKVRDGEYGEKYGTSTDVLPQQWLDGDYGALKESVDSAIKELTRKLRIIKVKDTSLLWQKDLKRGKINTKTLYRYPSGRVDIFKKKIEQEDRTRNFVFSLMIDCSGSMRLKNRGVNATRGTIILSEVFKQMSMPFEIISFGSDGKTQKGFNEDINNAVKIKIGKFAKANDNHTRMLNGLNVSKLVDRPEKNKYMIVLTDGETADGHEVKIKIKDLEDKGVKILGFDLSDNKSLAGIIDNVRRIDEANNLPTEFESMLKNIIKKI